jgi:hypothetical protein
VGRYDPIICSLMNSCKEHNLFLGFLWPVMKVNFGFWGLAMSHVEVVPTSYIQDE